MIDMRQDLEKLGAELWPDDAVLRPPEHGGLHPTGPPWWRGTRSVLVGVATAALIFLVIAVGLSLSRSRESTGSAVPHGSGSGPIGPLEMVSPSAGWSISGGLVAHTSDAANTFVDVTPVGIDSNHQVNASARLDAQHAWVVVGAPTGTSTWTVYRTSDGGSTWNSSSVGMHGGNADITFVDSLHGWLQTTQLINGDRTQAVRLVKSTDGGVSWTTIFTTEQRNVVDLNSPPGDCLSRGIRFATTQRGFMGLNCPPGAAPQMDMTEDGGSTWRRLTLPRPSLPAGFVWGSSVDAPIFDNAASGTAFMSACVGTHTECQLAAVIYRTWNGGRDWTPGTVVGVSGGAVSFGDAFHAWAPLGCLTPCNSPLPVVLLHTSDAGITWDSLPIPSALGPNRHGFQQFNFVSSVVGFGTSWLAGPGGSNPTRNDFRTNDGGRTWMPFSPRLTH